MLSFIAEVKNMKIYYTLITVLMLLPLALTGAGYLAAPDALAPDLTMHLGCGAVTLLEGCVMMLKAQKALKGHTYVGKSYNRVKVSGKKGARQLLQVGLAVTGLSSVIFSLLILMTIL